MFQIAAPDSIRLEIAEGMAELEVAEDRRRIAEDATRRLQSDLNGFIRESVASMREETARLPGSMAATQLDALQGMCTIRSEKSDSKPVQLTLAMMRREAKQ